MIKTTKNTKSTAGTTKTVSAKPTQAAVVNTVAVRKPSPEPASRISLELVKSEAKEVYVAGSFNGWVPQKSPLSNTGNGRWVGNLAIGPGRYEYLFVVDGQWLPDPNARETVDNPFGGKNSVLVVSE
jgi:1,4-alpha-glucan branching enzyme